MFKVLGILFSVVNTRVNFLKVAEPVLLLLEIEYDLYIILSEPIVLTHSFVDLLEQLVQLATRLLLNQLQQ